MTSPDTPPTHRAHSGYMGGNHKKPVLLVPYRPSSTTFDVPFSEQAVTLLRPMATAAAHPIPKDVIYSAGGVATILPETTMSQQQPRTFQGPLLGLLLAANILARASQAKPYLADQSPWIPFRPYFAPLSSAWYPISEGIYATNQATTNSPQIQSPPLNQQQIIHIHDSLPPNNDSPEESYQDAHEQNHQHIVTNIFISDDGSEKDAESSNISLPDDEVITASDGPEQTTDVDAFLLSSQNFGDEPDASNKVSYRVGNKTDDMEEVIHRDNLTKIDSLNVSSALNNITVIERNNSLDKSEESFTEIICTQKDIASEASSTNTFFQRKRFDDLRGNDKESLTRKNNQEINDSLDKHDNFKPNDSSTEVIYTNKEFASEALSTNTFFQRQRFDDLSGNGKARPMRKNNQKRQNYHSHEFDYEETKAVRNRYRRRPSKRRTTTPSYDEYDTLGRNRPNRRKRRPPMRNRVKGNRRPVNSYYDSNEYGDDYYDDNYNIFARQGTTTEEYYDYDSSSTTETSASRPTSSTGSTRPTTNSPGTSHHPTGGYTYGPPHSGYGPPRGNENVSNTYSTTGGYTYGPPHSGYGPSNGNENISITYGPPTGAKQDAGAPLYDSWYNHYMTGSVFRRLQELLTPNNFYNHQYDDNYHDSF